jgi:hypothetical protein
MSVFATAQQPAPPPQQVKVHVLNLCTPSQEEQKEIAAALPKIQKQPIFTPDFEVARGRSTLDHDAIRSGGNTSMSREPATASDPTDLAQLSVADNAAAVTGAAPMLGSAIAVTRIRLERLGKRLVVLARCMASESNPPPNKSAYEPLSRDGSSLMDRYRTLLQARQTVPEELANVGSASVRSNPQLATRRTGRP